MLLFYVYDYIVENCGSNLRWRCLLLIYEERTALLGQARENSVAKFLSAHVVDVTPPGPAARTRRVPTAL